MKNIKNIMLLGMAVFVSCFVHAALVMPTLRVVKIANATPYQLGFKDLINDRSFVAKPSWEYTFSNFEIIGARSIPVRGNLFNSLAEHGQFVIYTCDDNGDSVNFTDRTYMNIALQEGGMNDGSGIVSGTPGTIAFNFLLASLQGGCVMSFGSLKNPLVHTVEIELEFYITPENLAKNTFSLDCNYKFHEIAD